MKSIKAIICAALSVCLLAVPLSSAVVFNAGAEDVQTLQDKLAELDAKSAEYQAELDKYETDINEKEAYSAALINKIDVLNERLSSRSRLLPKPSRTFRPSKAKSTRQTAKSTSRSMRCASVCA